VVKEHPTANPAEYPPGSWVADPELERWLTRQEAQEDRRRAAVVKAAYDKAERRAGRPVGKEEAFEHGWNERHGGWGIFLRWRKIALRLKAIPEDPPARPTNTRRKSW
jgi:hypothetical protein